MMYLSHLLIDIGHDPDRPRPGRLWVRNPYRVHQRLCMAFPSAVRKAEDPDFLNSFHPGDFGNSQVHVARGTESGFLFRIDLQGGGRAVVLVQSAVKPDWTYAFHNAGCLLAAPVEMKCLDLDPREGQIFRFRLVANPTRKIDTKSGPDGRKRNGRRVPVQDGQLLDWLISRAEPGGFALEAESTTVQPGYVYLNKGRDGDGCRMRSVRYEGILQVTGSAGFREALVHGIGPGKAFGFGLLSVAPVHTSGREEPT